MNRSFFFSTLEPLPFEKEKIDKTIGIIHIVRKLTSPASSNRTIQISRSETGLSSLVRDSYKNR